MNDLAELCLQNKLRDSFDSVEALKTELVSTMIHELGLTPDRASTRDWFFSLAHLLRQVLSERNIRTARKYYNNNVKRVYYLSMEYLIGRNLEKVLYDLEVREVTVQALAELGHPLEEVIEAEHDAAIGNGGLGRLAACFLDSMTTHDYPNIGYGLRFEYGMFAQTIEDGQQVEKPENWLRYGNPWEIERPAVFFPVRFGGKIVTFKNGSGEEKCEWVDTEEVYALAYDIPMSGFNTESGGNLRLWSARSPNDFDLGLFNQGNYAEAVREKTDSENLTKVLYPNDNNTRGQELRLKQEYFFVSASIQDIVNRFLRTDDDLTKLPEKNVIQLNDTHPALGIPELLRILIDEHGLSFADAWEISRQTFAYTNHTLLPEALETWSLDMLGRILPRHLEIIFQINDVFLKMVRRLYPGDPTVLGRLSLVDDFHRSVRMAHLAIVGSTRVNGVAELHTKLLREHTFPEFDEIYPGKFVNMTNGITPRRWLLQANPGLSDLITEAIGPDWKRHLPHLKALEPFADDSGFRDTVRAIKAANKERLAAHIEKTIGLRVGTGMLFDTQAKRIHEYKRQLLNLLQVIARYNRLKENPAADMVPRTVIFAGKAASGYDMAKLIIRLINDVAEIVNHDPDVNDRLKIAFCPNYSVSLAEIIIPGSELSEQISTAGTEASGTGNMKFALNGALTIGTMDGANIEIHDEVGTDNIFIFGLDAKGARELRAKDYDPNRYYDQNAELKQVLDMIRSGYFSADDPFRHRPIADSLLRGGDHYLLLADFESYMDCQDRVDAAYRDGDDWTRRAVINIANMGRFSSDETIHRYAETIWGVKPSRD
jgi:starch phosphorylase